MDFDFPGLLLLAVFGILCFRLIRTVAGILLYRRRTSFVGFDGDKKCQLQVKSDEDLSRPLNVMVVLGSGGHTAEMLTCLAALDRQRYRRLVYVAADSDSASVRRALEQDARLAGSTPENLSTASASSSPSSLEVASDVELIPRARRVGQSYITSVPTTLWSIMWCFGLIWRRRPDLVGFGDVVASPHETFATIRTTEGPVEFCFAWPVVARFIFWGPGVDAARNQVLFD